MKRNAKRGRLMLMRHAKADRSDPKARDFDRPLTSRGRKAVAPMAKWLMNRGFVPGLILSSPAVRARDTALLLAAELGVRESDVAFDEDIYEANVAGLQRVLQRAVRGRADDALLLVGHNPGLDDFLCHLCLEPPSRDEEGKLLTTAAIAVLDFDGPVDARAGCARLTGLKRPKDPD